MRVTGLFDITKCVMVVDFLRSNSHKIIKKQNKALQSNMLIVVPVFNIRNKILMNNFTDKKNDFLRKKKAKIKT